MMDRSGKYAVIEPQEQQKAVTVTQNRANVEQNIVRTANPDRHAAIGPESVRRFIRMRYRAGTTRPSLNHGNKLRRPPAAKPIPG